LSEDLREVEVRGSGPSVTTPTGAPSDASKLPSIEPLPDEKPSPELGKTYHEDEMRAMGLNVPAGVASFWTVFAFQNGIPCVEPAGKLVGNRRYYHSALDAIRACETLDALSALKIQLDFSPELAGARRGTRTKWAKAIAHRRSQLS
jgi:hypothetical protein